MIIALTNIFFSATIAHSQTISYAGIFINTTYNLHGTITLNITFNPNDSISGYANVTGGSDGIQCSAGYFKGIRKTDSLYYVFISHDTDQGCGYDWGVTDHVNGLLINGFDSLTGSLIYAASSGTQNGIYFVKRLYNTGSINVTTGNDWRIYPNPAIDQLTIDFKNPINGTATITITDQFGRLQSTHIVSSLATSYTENVAKLNPGVYIIHINSQLGEIQNYMFVKR